MRCALVTTALVIGGCGQVGSAPPPNAPTESAAPAGTTSEDSAGRQPGKLVVASVSVSPAEAPSESDITVVVNIENKSKEKLNFPEEEFTSPNVLLQVRDALGEKVLAAPPPTPTGRQRTIEPGKRVEIKMSLAGMFSPPLKPGQYNVRVRRIDSTPHAFRITPRQ